LRCAKLLPLIIGPWLCSCTIVNVYGKDGVETHEYFGVTVISARPDERPVYVRAEGVGIVGGPRDVAVGWIRQDIAAFPDPAACALMIVPSDFRDLPDAPDAMSKYPLLFDPCRK